MSVRPPPVDLLPWATAQLPRELQQSEAAFTMVAGDASQRRYFRLSPAAASVSYIVVEAPPASEKNPEFIAVQQLLAQAGILVPDILAFDLERGYLLLQDLGSRMLLPELEPSTVDQQYRQAFSLLLRMGRCEPVPPWPAYDKALLSEELSRFPQWFVQALLGCQTFLPERALWQEFSALLIDNALVQPQVLVHRDFHSRNLMPQDSGGLALIDFQDAVTGPITYDLASLLRDCYIRWPAEQVEAWVLEYRQLLLREGLLDNSVSGQQFVRWFDLIGLQRHIKVLGTFARLYLRDNKDSYLDDLPLVLAYVCEMLTKYREQEPAVAAFDDWFCQEILPLCQAQTWFPDNAITRGANT